MKWTRIDHDTHVSGDYTLQIVRNIRTNRHDENVWVVHYQGERITVQSTRKDAEQAAEAHNGAQGG